MFYKTSMIYNATGRVIRNVFINPANRKKLNNHNFSIISNNCTGSLITHDLGERFLTPTVNLYISTGDFVKFVGNLDFYLQKEIEQVFKEGVNWPIGKLGDIEIHFAHYKNINEAKEKWHERSKRINYDNIYIMMTDGNGCSNDIIKQFEELPYKNKVLLTNKNYEQYNSSFYVKGFENVQHITDLSLYKNIFGQKFYDNFDYIKWLNN